MWFFGALFKIFSVFRRKKRKSKRQLIRERNRRLAIILNHVRQQQHARQNAPSTENLTRTIERIRRKKERAKKEARGWSKQVLSTSRDRGVETRVREVSERLRTKRARARSSW